MNTVSFGQIASVQASTQQAVEAICELTNTIAAINGIASVIAESVQQQDAAARDMSANMQTAAAGMASIKQLCRLSSAGGF